MATLSRLDTKMPQKLRCLTNRWLTNISQLYREAQAALPFTEQERNMLNNALIRITHEQRWNRELYAKGVPPFLLSSPEFREKFIQFADKDARDKEAIRRQIISEATSLHCPKNAEKSRMEEFGSIYELLSGSIVRYVQKEMPKTMLIFHGARHMADLTKPQMEAPARTFRRNIIAHIGPPNSGKTYEAHQRLTASKSGVYCSPLRLLAWEMHKRLMDANVNCALLTGQENRSSYNDTHMACTVEMTPLDRYYECAVIDEMQMLGDPNRGYAWTRAFLGLRAPEVHICGNPSCYIIAKYLANISGDTLQITEHQRLGGITVMEEPVSVGQLQPGDCVVCFSRNTALNLLENIESTCFKNNGERPTTTAVVYGSLPPEARTQQIEAFNARKKQILVASDVIGMGVNVRIKRIIFHRVAKFDGNKKRLLSAAEIQQIAGRAGRYSLDCGTGYVGCLRSEDIGYLKRMMKQQQEQIERAVVAPTPQTIAAFADSIRSATDPPATLAEAIKIYKAMAQTGGAFEICDVQAMIKVAKALENICMPNDVLVEYLFVPLGSQPALVLVLRAFALSHAVLNNVKLKNILHQGAVDMLDADGQVQHTDPDAMKRLEMLYQILDAYVWLWHKFPNVYVDYHAILIIKKNITKTLNDMLDKQLQMRGHCYNTDEQEDRIIDANVARELIRTEHCL